MKKSILLTLLCATLFTGAKAQDTKEYKTYVKNDYLIHYCNHKGVTVVVDVTEGGLFVPNISIINDSGHEIIFEPKKIKAYCYAVKGHPKETRNMLTRYFDMGMDMTPLVKDSLMIYPYEKYKSKRNSSMFWANTLVTVLVGTADAALSKDTPDDRFWARKHTEDMIDEGEAQRGIEMQRIDEGYWRANTIFDMSEHSGFIALKKRKADHIVLEIPVDGEVYTFLVDNRKRY